MSGHNKEYSKPGPLYVSDRWIIKGMHCADCAARLETVLNKTPGVKKACIRFPTGVLGVDYDVRSITPEKFGDIVAEMGFHLTTSSVSPDTQIHPHRHHTNITGAVHILTGMGCIALGFLLRYMDIQWYPFLFMTAALVTGIPVAKSGVATLRMGGGLNINILTVVAGMGALLLGEWAEGAAVLTLFGIGEYLERRAGEQARRSVRKVMELVPVTARIKNGDKLVQIDAVKVEPGDVAVVFPGEKIPADGRVSLGYSGVNEATITGESLPVDKSPGSQVYAGTLNGEGTIEIVITKKSKDTALSRIIDMIEDAQSRKSHTQRAVDVFARYWTPAMLILALILSAGVPLFFRLPFKEWIYRGLTVLIVSCPCSLVISTPVTVVAAISKAAQNGVLIKGGIHLENLSKVNIAAFDKTGTLTRGRIQTDKIVPVNEKIHPLEVLRLAVSVEARSEHPLAKAIVQFAESIKFKYEVGDHFVALRGKGAKAKLKGTNVFVGNHVLFQEIGVSIPGHMQELSQEIQRAGSTVVFVGTKSGLTGMISFRDMLRPESARVVDEIKSMGIHAVLLTGDSKDTAKVVADSLKIPSVYAGLMPDEKVERICWFAENNGVVVMVGDGVNDAPSLAAATVGIAMGTGTDVALETADVALMKDDLTKIPWAIALGVKTKKLIVENLTFSILVKLAALIMVILGILPLWLAVLADSGASVVVTLNGLRILGFSK